MANSSKAPCKSGLLQVSDNPGGQKYFEEKSSNFFRIYSKRTDRGQDFSLPIFRKIKEQTLRNKYRNNFRHRIRYH